MYVFIFKVADFVLLGNGYCRSEAAVVALLTKRSFAKRVYATVVNAGNNTDGFKEQGELLRLVEQTGSTLSLPEFTKVHITRSIRV